MSNRIPNRKVICDVLMEHAVVDKDIVVLCSDSRGSASLTPFFERYPGQSVEVGIAEQDLVGIAAGLAKSGKKPYAASPASFLSTRSYEQVKVDCAYSGQNVKLIGISGGISYGALGMSHHSAQDIAAMTAIPGMRVYLPSDRFQTRKLFEALLADEKPAYIRTGRNPVEDVYTEENCPFEMDRATLVREGSDVAILACGEMVRPAADAAELLAAEGISAQVLDMYCLKPVDREAVLRAARTTRAIVTVEEHAPFGGLGAITAQIVSENDPKKVLEIALPDEPVITGTSAEVFDYYGMNAEGIAQKAKEALA
ncbi:transketolase family protein [Lachnoclostridium sp. Marseille-P6806]|uniref:transketolase family protein n=1 Tax=Lachnoclostridium sp. Marseille-P6806 TaxID=2364793 RepID=UPI00102FD44D|nr:transketolase C-terminal domain-containing protein [Lachnoclostridium sp. Marseille-P6806]